MNGQLAMFAMAPAAPSKRDQLAMFDELAGTALAQSDAVKLARKDQPISAAELVQRRADLNPWGAK